MSVLIKGMEMPKNCGECPMICEDDLCHITKGGRTINERPPHCPLIEVPPHGRLIDADYQKHTLCAECTLYPDSCLENTGGVCDWHGIAHLRMCPTIIEAEEGV